MSIEERVEVALTPDEARALLSAYYIEEGDGTSAAYDALVSAYEKLRIGLVEIGEAA